MFRKSAHQPLFGGTRYDYYDQGRKLGSVVFEKRFGKSVYLYDVEIDEPYRNHGYGTNMINEADSFTQSLYPDLRKLTLRVQIDNEIAYRLYTKCNYHITGRGTGTVTMEKPFANVLSKAYAR
ncbi:MAG: GNAT family N-acetyltransferase [Solobacterium sp.]|nr:GNAT family N-acetyltransferase [Solobacterium sp.]